MGRSTLVAGMTMLLAGGLLTVGGGARAQEPTPGTTTLPPLPVPPVLLPPEPADETLNAGVDATRRSALKTAPALPLRSRWRFDLPGAGHFTPLVAGGRVFTNSGASVIAIDLQTGKRVWTSAVAGELAYGAGSLFVAGASKLFALDPATGAPRWSVPSGGSGPVVAGDLVLLQGSGLVAFDVATGVQRWQGGSSDGTTGAPAVVGDRVYQSSPCSAVAADRRTGGVIWTREGGCSTGGGGGRTIAWQDEVVPNGVNGLGSPLSAADGVSRPGTVVSAIGGKVGLERSRGRGLRAVDMASGKILWRAGNGAGSFPFQAPTVFGGLVVRAQFDGEMEIRDLATGRLRWDGRLKSAARAPDGYSDAQAEVAGGGGLVIVARGATIDALEPGNAGGGLGVARPSRRNIVVGNAVTVTSHVAAVLGPVSVRIQAGAYPRGRLKFVGAPVRPEAGSTYSARLRPDSNSRLRLADPRGIFGPSTAFTTFVYPKLSFHVKNVQNRVTLRVGVRGGRHVRVRGRRLVLYAYRAAKRRAVRLASTVLRGPAHHTARGTVRFAAVRLARKDRIFACVVGLATAGNGDPRDALQHGCGRAVIR
jgi:outer membrane protein assembly factor BamB